MLLCWYARRMEVYASALTSVNWIQGPRRTLTWSHGYRKQLRAWLLQATFPAWLKGRVLADCDGWGFKAIHHFYCGEHRIFLKANTCCLGCVMPQPHFKYWCRTVWVSWTWSTIWSTWMMWSSFQRQQRNTYIACTLCLNTSGSTT